MLQTARARTTGPCHTDHEDAKSYSVQETFGEDISDWPRSSASPSG